MTKIYLVRHCEAEGNICRRAQTTFDGLPTTKGIAQSEALRKRFHDIQVDAVYCSDSCRARATADPIAADHGLKPRYRYKLREYLCGVYDSMPNGNVERMFADVVNHNNNNLGDLWYPGGDTTDSIERRCRWMLDEIVSENRDKTVVIVSHAVMARQILLISKGYPKERMKEIEYGDNTAVSLIETDGVTSDVKFMADVSHLSPELRKPWDHDCGVINMTVDRVRLPEDSALVARLSGKMDAMRGRRPSTDAYYVAYAAARLAENPDYATFYALSEEVRGMLLMRSDPSFTDEYEVVDGYFMDEECCAKQLQLQVLGHAIHVARKNCRKYVAFPKARNEWDRAILDRFQFEEIPGHPDYMRMCVLTPPCPYPVI